MKFVTQEILNRQTKHDMSTWRAKQNILYGTRIEESNWELGLKKLLWMLMCMSIGIYCVLYGYDCDYEEDDVVGGRIIDGHRPFSR